MSHTQDVLRVIQMMRDEPDLEYKILFEEAQDLAKHVESSLEMPTITKRQV
jgi:hypothetical protein